MLFFSFLIIRIKWLTLNMCNIYYIVLFFFFFLNKSNNTCDWNCTTCFVQILLTVRYSYFFSTNRTFSVNCVENVAILIISKQTLTINRFSFDLIKLFFVNALIGLCMSDIDQCLTRRGLIVATNVNQVYTVLCNVSISILV